MRTLVESLKRLLLSGKITSEKIEAMLLEGKITQEEHDYILNITTQGA